MISVSEKLNLNSQSNVVKTFRELQKGDEIYIWWEVGYEDGRDENVEITIRKIIDNLKLDLGDGYQYIFKFNDIKTWTGESHFWVKENELDNYIIYSSHDGYVISTNQTLLEKFIDDEIDKILKPYQDELSKLQHKINDILEKKAKKIIVQMK
jgi:hypothetical protein